MPQLCLADAANSLPDPSSSVAVGFLVLTLFGIFAGLNQLLTLWKNLKGISQPDPDHVSLDRVAAIEKRMREMELKMENHMGGIQAQFKNISDTLTNLQTDWNYAIGRLDGRTEAQRDSR